MRHIITLTLPLFLFFNATAQVKLNQKLDAYVKGAIAESVKISDERKTSLKEIADYTAMKIQKKEEAKMLFICTHNSRRSHMAQAWSWAAAYYFGLDNVLTYSGGTETTAFNPRAIRTLQEAGFFITKSGGESTNPTYLLALNEHLAPITMFSKKYDHASNPKSGFVAIMVCSDADASCPLVSGAEERVAVPYDDPKHFDNTPSENLKYDESCKLIASEMFFMMGQVKNKINSQKENK